ncbi:MAG: hypothetical protein A2166_02090 [Omnitrophica WOR_2 bacterium RBG_13_41_10]|nr:MAG: hypothetical protein A2166_02090 [Omnitrophica WOR_2 bacterium RBG_13_41_10]
MREIILDPEFNKLIIPLTKEECGKLKENILKDGFCRDPLVLWRGILLDGHHRYKICRENNIEFKTVEISLSDRNAAKAWMYSNQLGRRNLTHFKRVEMLLQLAELQCINSDMTKSELAIKAGVSRDTLYRALKIIERASEKTKNNLREGKTTINAAYSKINGEEIKAQHPKRRGSQIKRDFAQDTLFDCDLKKLFRNLPAELYCLAVELNELPDRFKKCDLSALATEEQRASMLDILLSAQKAIASARESLKLEAAAV